MSIVNLQDLTNLAEKALASEDILLMIELSKKKIEKSKEPFIWEVLSERLLRGTFPEGIRSAWMFFLRPNSSSPSHRHPNSVQYSAIVEGGGMIRIGKVQKKIQIFDPLRRQAWYVIRTNVPHEFITGIRTNVVLSFHTVRPNELIEVETSTGRSRFYET